MDDDHRQKPSWLDAFSEDGACEDGLTDSRRSVFTGTLVPAQKSLPPVPPPEPPSAVVRARHTLDVLGAYVPERIANEQIGDALELIHKLVLAGAPKWKVRAQVASTTFWVLAHTGLELALRVAGAVKKALRS
jgi:hypothetical protein